MTQGVTGSSTAGPTGNTGAAGATGPVGPSGVTTAMPALNIDWSLGSCYSKTLAAGANAITMSNTVDGQTVTAKITGAASTLTWTNPGGLTILWAAGAAPTQTPAGIDVYTFVRIGTTILGNVVQAMA
jgi:hypothetical protein